MNRASEWAAARGRVDQLYRSLMFPSRYGHQVRVAMAMDENPVLEIVATDAIQFSQADALRLAAWILEVFGGAPPEP